MAVGQWYSVKACLPAANYNWVIVACLKLGENDVLPWYIAQYTSDGWKFYGDKAYKDDEQITCPDFSDQYENMSVREITHWMQLPDLYYEVVENARF